MLKKINYMVFSSIIFFMIFGILAVNAEIPYTQDLCEGGTAFSSSNYVTNNGNGIAYQPEWAFNNTTDPGSWIPINSSNTIGEFIGYHFSQPKKIGKVRILHLEYPIGS